MVVGQVLVPNISFQRITCIPLVKCNDIMNFNEMYMKMTELFRSYLICILECSYPFGGLILGW